MALRREAMQELSDWVRQKCPPGRTPLFVAHNGNVCDFRRLQIICARHSIPAIGSDWHILDTYAALKHDKKANTAFFGSLGQVRIPVQM